MTPSSAGLAARRDLAVAVWRTWGARGLGRRAAYEVVKRSGRLERAEARWTSGAGTLPPALRSAGTTPPAGIAASAGELEGSGPLRLYGGLDVGPEVPPDWHRHPLTGHRFDRTSHWSTFDDASAEDGDIKDVWELARFGWLQPRLRRWAATGDEGVAEQIWTVVEDWVDRNPPFDGPHWMCGQEASLRAITVMFLADALDGSATTTAARRSGVAALVRSSVGRVAPTMGYALSQRNNHAVSEAAFLWTAALLVPGLPDASGLRRTAGRALTEAVTDQFASDGSYAQHSPTYQRVALHALLWCLLVARTTGARPPDGVVDAVGRSVPFLRSLVAPGSEGRVPNLGGNDGALVFDLAPTGVTDLRPVIAHAAAATGQASGFGPGPWDEEPRWFGLAPVSGGHGARPAAVATRALTCGTTHVVVRAGPFDHRPAHADQLHTDIWLAGRPVAVDPGSYRYTAPAPWGNALAGDDVHNVPRRAGAPQAVRAGRFFWRRWTQAVVTLSVEEEDLAALVAVLDLPDGTRLHRLVAARAGLVVVVDRASQPVTVRWNLDGVVAVAPGGPGSARATSTSVTGRGWVGRVDHGGGAEVPVPSDDVPASGWQAPTYGTREPLTALLVPSDPAGLVVSCFAEGEATSLLGAVAPRAAALDPLTADRAAVAQVLRPS